jgi:hypothetical protein
MRWVGFAVVSLVACSDAAPRAAAVWTGPWMPTPNGGRRTTIYYGPWQCTARWLEECSGKCAGQGRRSLGCIWIADIKFDWEGQVGPVPIAGGGRLAITHCCCDYAIVSSKEGRDAWDQARAGFRERWAGEFGAWPREAGGRFWQGHHIRDLMHGGDPVADGNVLPVPTDMHYALTNEYRACYAAGSRWAQPGPQRPYAD